MTSTSAPARHRVDRTTPARRREPLAALPPPDCRAGDPALAEAAFEALQRAASEPNDPLTHGFHSYPARLHPGVASALLDALATPDARVVDPFCGSGTVLVEAMRRGLRSFGSDLSPLALRIAEVRTDRRSAGERDRFLATLEQVTEASKERVRARAASRAPVERADAAMFDPHVLRELGGLREEILAVTDRADRRALEVVLSSILTKVSHRRGDTDERETPKRIGRFIPTEMCARKGQELVSRWAALDDACVAVCPRPRLQLGDARELRRLVRERRADLLVTSPPYGGTYDYASHQRFRLPWLGLDGSALDAGEIGARRHADRGGLGRWDHELVSVLAAIASTLSPQGLAVLIVGDGQLGAQRLDAEAHLRRLAPGAGLALVAQASAPRPDWTRRRARREHVLVLRPLVASAEG